MIEFSCASCGKRYKLEDHMAGKRAKCKCGSVLQVPSASVAPAAEAEMKTVTMTSPAPVAPPRKTPPAAPEPEPAAAAQCPSCGAEMAATAVLCIECGFDKRTGKRLSGL
jgi:hypothetical protein